MITYEEFEDFVKSYLDCDDDEINKDTNLLKSCGIDSLTLFTIMIKAEKKFNFKKKIDVNENLYNVTMLDMYNELARQLESEA